MRQTSAESEVLDDLLQLLGPLVPPVLEDHPGDLDLGARQSVRLHLASGDPASVRRGPLLAGAGAPGPVRGPAASGPPLPLDGQVVAELLPDELLEHLLDLVPGPSGGPAAVVALEGRPDGDRSA
jgi:hypothetical protein